MINSVPLPIFGNSPCISAMPFRNNVRPYSIPILSLASWLSGEKGLKYFVLD